MSLRFFKIFDGIFKEFPTIVKLPFLSCDFWRELLSIFLKSVILHNASKFKNIDKMFPDKVFKSFYVDSFNCSVSNLAEAYLKTNF